MVKNSRDGRLDVNRPRIPSGKHQAVGSTVYYGYRPYGAAGQYSMTVPPTFSAGEHKDATHEERQTQTCFC